MSDLNDKIVKMYEQGCSTHEIAKTLNTYPNKVRRILLKCGIKLRTASQAQKKSLERGVSTHPTKGKKRTEEEKLAISGSLSSYWENLSDEEKQKKVDQCKDHWASMSDEQRRNMTIKGREAIRKAAKGGSKLEGVIYRGLIDAGYSVEQHKMLFPTEKLEIDLYISDIKTIIEIDGPSHFLPIWGEDHLQKQEQFDLKKNGTLLTRGYVVIRVKALNAMSLKRNKDLLDTIVDNLKSIEEKFPPKSRRFIEVEL